MDHFSSSAEAPSRGDATWLVLSVFGQRVPNPTLQRQKVMSTTRSTAIRDSSVNDHTMRSEAERVLIERVERKMEEMMSKYDSSHDKYHGMLCYVHSFILCHFALLLFPPLRALEGFVGYAMTERLVWFSHFFLASSIFRNPHSSNSFTLQYI